MKSQRRIFLIFIFLMIVVTGCLDKINENILDDNLTNERLEKLNDVNIIYSEQGSSTLNSAAGKFGESKDKSIGKKIASLEIGKELALDAENQFRLGKDVNYELWNLSWKLYKTGRWNESKLKRNQKIIEINLKYYNTLISSSEYLRKGYDEFLAYNEIVKYQPSEEEELFGFIVSALSGKPDLSKISKLSKGNVDAQIKLEKGSEYLMMSFNQWYSIDTYKGGYIYKGTEVAYPLCNVGKCNIDDMMNFNKLMGVWENLQCKDWGLEEDCNYIKIKIDELEKCLKDKTCSIEEAAEKIKERNVYVKSLLPPRKIDI